MLYSGYFIIQYDAFNFIVLSCIVIDPVIFCFPGINLSSLTRMQSIKHQRNQEYIGKKYNIIYNASENIKNTNGIRAILRSTRTARYQKSQRYTEFYYRLLNTYWNKNIISKSVYEGNRKFAPGIAHTQEKKDSIFSDLLQPLPSSAMNIEPYFKVQLLIHAPCVILSSEMNPVSFAGNLVI